MAFRVKFSMNLQLPPVLDEVINKISSKQLIRQVRFIVKYLTI
jgi:hypothetical protein